MYNIKQATNIFLEMETILFSIHAKRQYLQLELEYNYFLHWQNKENHFMYLYCMVLSVWEPVPFLTGSRQSALASSNKGLASGSLDRFYKFLLLAPAIKMSGYLAPAPGSRF